jgi:hypothetical protein
MPCTRQKEKLGRMDESVWCSNVPWIEVGASGDMDWLAKEEDRNERVKVKGVLLVANVHPKRDGQSDRDHNKNENTTVD